MSKSSKKPPKITQEDLRRLMKQKSQNKRIDSPFAKYNSLDQLTCSVCHVPVKSDLLWNAHVMSKTHKENLLNLNAQGAELPLKRPFSFKETKITKKVKMNSEPQSEPPSTKPKPNPPQSQIKSILKNSSQLKTHSKEKKTVEDKKKNETKEDEKDEDGKKQIEKEGREEEEDEEDEKEQPNLVPEVAKLIPEGFFDDPKLDAKVRQVPYREKFDEEMELFQKVIKEEAQVSEAIQEEEDEERDEQRELDQIDEQMSLWAKVNSLAKLKKPVSKTEKKKEESSSEDEENDKNVNSILDWRNKSAF